MPNCTHHLPPKPTLPVFLISFGSNSFHPTHPNPRNSLDPFLSLFACPTLHIQSNTKSFQFYLSIYRIHLLFSLPLENRKQIKWLCHLIKSNFLSLVYISPLWPTPCTSFPAVLSCHSTQCAMSVHTFMLLHTLFSLPVPFSVFPLLSDSPPSPSLLFIGDLAQASLLMGVVFNFFSRKNCFLPCILIILYIFFLIIFYCNCLFMCHLLTS